METRSYRPKRSVRHAEIEAQRPPRQPSSAHVGRRQRERRLQRYIIIGAVVAVLLVVLIPAYGYWREVIHLGDAPLVTVGGLTITVEDYARYLGTRQAILTRQIGQAQAAIPTPAASPTPRATATSAASGGSQPTAAPSTTAAPALTPTTQPSSEVVDAQQTLEVLYNEQSGLSTTALTDLVEAHLLLDEAKKRNLVVSQSEIDNALRWMMSSPPPGLEQSLGLQAAPTQISGANLVTLEQAQQALTTVVGKGRFLTASQVVELILKPAVIKGKLLDEYGKDVPRTSEQVHARHILVATEDEAKQIREQLVGGADFATLAKEKSTDSTKDKGGDLGWFGRGVMVPEFENAAFSLKVGEISQPIKTQFGYHIIQVLEKDPNHPVDSAQVKRSEDQEYQSWLGKQQSDPKQVVYQETAPKLTWVQSYVGQGN